jgi:hypothetical protein
MRFGLIINFTNKKPQRFPKPQRFGLIINFTNEKPQRFPKPLRFGLIINFTNEKPQRFPKPLRFGLKINHARKIGLIGPHIFFAKCENLSIEYSLKTPEKRESKNKNMFFSMLSYFGALVLLKSQCTTTIVS